MYCYVHPSTNYLALVHLLWINNTHQAHSFVISTRLEDKFFFGEFWKYRYGGKKCVNYEKFKSWQNSVNQIFNPHALFFFLLTGATWYYHAIYIVITYSASFTGYEDDIFEIISNMHVQVSKFGGKFDKFGRLFLFLIDLRVVHGVRFFHVW